MGRRALEEHEIRVFRTRAVQAARELFREGGLPAVSMRNLARRLGCSANTPYRYFEDHEELVSTLRADTFASFADQIETAAETAPLDHALQIIARTYVDYAIEYADAYRLMFTLDPPTRRHEALEHHSRRSFQPLVEAVGDDLEAHLIWIRLHGLVSLHLADKLNLGRSLAELCDALLADLETR